MSKYISHKCKIQYYYINNAKGQQYGMLDNASGHINKSNHKEKETLDQTMTLNRIQSKFIKSIIMTHFWVLQRHKTIYSTLCWSSLMCTSNRNHISLHLHSKQKCKTQWFDCFKLIVQNWSLKVEIEVPEERRDFKLPDQRKTWIRQTMAGKSKAKQQCPW